MPYKILFIKALLLLLTGVLSSCSPGKSDDNLIPLLILNEAENQTNTAAVSASTENCIYSGNPAGAPVTGSVLITEVKLCYGWMEIYNGTDSDIDLSAFQLKVNYSYNSNTSLSDNHTIYSLPAMIVHSGQFAVIRSDSWNTKYDYRDVISLNNADGFSPAFYYTSGSYIELLKDGITVDYVNINTVSPSPATADAWSGLAVAPVSCSTIRRNENFTDTNSASDWTAGTENTPHLPNTASCAQDTDLDGLPDCAETEGVYYRGYSYYAWGARTNQKDIFIEMDFMDQTDAGCTNCPDQGMAPLKSALDSMKSKFAEKGWTLHYDVGDFFDRDGISGNNPENYDLCNGGLIPYFPAVDFSETEPGVTDVNSIRKSYMIGERAQSFHYLVFADTCKADGSDCSFWGKAYMPGSTILIAQRLKNFSKQSAVFYQFGTVMHELGHNLSLGHGGFENTNYKPNYLSIMNYLYRYVPPADSYAGQEYYSYAKNTLEIDACASFYSWDNFPYSSDKAGTLAYVDFSSGSAPDIDENNINDTAGYGGSYPSIDFNCDGSYNSGYSLDLNNDSSYTVLKDNNDWNQVAVFSAGSAGNIVYSSAADRSGPEEILAGGMRQLPGMENVSRGLMGYSKGPDGRNQTIPTGVGNYLLIDERLTESLLTVVE